MANEGHVVLGCNGSTEIQYPAVATVQVLDAGDECLVIRNVNYLNLVDRDCGSELPVFCEVLDGA